MENNMPSLPFHQTPEARAKADAINRIALSLGLFVAKMRARRGGR